MKIVIVGAGVAGLMAANLLQDKHDVTLIERNSELGKKILVTGNGHCNYWNKDININKYNTDNYEVLKKILSNQDECYNYLTNHFHIYPYIKDSYYYPYNREAKSIRDSLISNLNHVNILLNSKVTNIENVNHKFNITINNEKKITCDKLILSTGSYSSYKDANTYDLLNNLKIKVNKVLPALSKLKVKENINILTGIRCYAKVSLFINKELVQEEQGELQFNRNFLSGICTFNISSKCNKALDNKSDVYIKINYLNNIEDILKENSNIKIKDLLRTYFPNKLYNYFINNLNINDNLSFNELNNQEKYSLIDIISNSVYHPIIEYNYDSQVCTGGVSLNQVNEELDYLDIPNLSLLGELLDVDGICGGFNIAFALICGYIVGNKDD